MSTRVDTVDGVAREPEWLTADEERLWRRFIEVSGRVVQALDASLKSNADLSFDDYEVLVHLSEADERRLRMAELSDRLLYSRSRLTQRVDRLVGRGFVVRERCEDDGRGMFAVLTDDGLSAIRAAAPIHVVDVRRVLLAHIEPEEFAVVDHALGRIAAAARDRPFGDEADRV